MPQTIPGSQNATFKQKSKVIKSSVLKELVSVLTIFTISVVGIYTILSVFEYFKTALYDHLSSSLLLGGLLGVFVLVLIQKIKRRSEKIRKA